MGLTPTRFPRREAPALRGKMSDIIVAIFIVATIVGLKKSLYGSVAGLLLSIAYCLFGKNIGIYSWVLMLIFGAFFGFMIPLSVRWLFSGLRGGRGKTEPGKLISVALVLEERVSFSENGLRALYQQITKRQNGLKMSKRGVKEKSEF